MNTDSGDERAGDVESNDLSALPRYWIIVSSLLYFAKMVWKMYTSTNPLVTRKAKGF